MYKTASAQQNQQQPNSQQNACNYFNYQIDLTRTKKSQPNEF
jgi:hypothetical protein